MAFVLSQLPGDGRWRRTLASSFASCASARAKSRRSVGLGQVCPQAGGPASAASKPRQVRMDQRPATFAGRSQTRSRVMDRRGMGMMLKCRRGNNPPPVVLAADGWPSSAMSWGPDRFHSDDLECAIVGIPRTATDTPLKAGGRKPALWPTASPFDPGPIRGSSPAGTPAAPADGQPITNGGRCSTTNTMPPLYVANAQPVSAECQSHQRRSCSGRPFQRSNTADMLAFVRVLVSRPRVLIPDHDDPTSFAPFRQARHLPIRACSRVVRCSALSLRGFAAEPVTAALAAIMVVSL